MSNFCAYFINEKCKLFNFILFIFCTITGCLITYFEKATSSPIRFTESLKVNDFPFPQEFDHIIYIRIIGEPQNIFIGDTGFLFWCDHP